MPYTYDPADNLHGFYLSKTNSFYKSAGHNKFASEVDALVRALALGLWQSVLCLKEDHVLAVNSLYSRGQPRPTYLYWELVSAVSDFDGLEVPEFFRVLAVMDDKISCKLLIELIKDILMRLTDPLEPQAGEFEFISGVVSGFNQVLTAGRPLDQAPKIMPIVKTDKPLSPKEETLMAPKEKTKAAAEASAPADKKASLPIENLEALLAELDCLVGLAQIKSDVKSLINLIKVRKLRVENELPVPPMSLHMVFTGNPGTGKTTVARLLSRLYHSIGVLSVGTLVEVDRSGLVAGYVGQTALKTQEAIEKAKGGILFIDEAYSLAPEGGGNDYGREAIEIILKNMEDNRADLVVIAAGYEEPMERFISSNPGLESRFGKYFTFEDYNGDELFEIFMSMCSKNKYAPDPEAEAYIKEVLNDMFRNRDDNFGNARDVRNLFEKIITRHSDRIAKLEVPTREDLMTFMKDDLFIAGP